MTSFATRPATHTTTVKPARPRTEDGAVDSHWVEFKYTGSKDIRNKLVLHYAPLVRYVAGRSVNGIPGTIEFRDLVQWGMIGLHDAIEKFDLNRGLKFETYAVTRIRGAIIDEIRNGDWVPRSVRTKIKDVERAHTVLEKELARTPTDEEVADHLTITVTDLRTIYGQASFTNIAALDEILHPKSGLGDIRESTLGDRTTDHQSLLPDVSLEDAEAVEALTEAIQSLTERDRVVIILYYYENLTLAEIGQVLNITESRVCQLHTKACMALKTKMLAFHNDCDSSF